MAKIEGRNPVIEALRGRRKIEKILLQQGISGEKISWITARCREKEIPLERVKRNTLDRLASSEVHQGVIAFAEEIKLITPGEMVKEAAAAGADPLLIILDQIQDPHNLGSIIRTAYAAGSHGLIFQERRAAGLTPAAVKASAGAVEHLPLSRVTNINQTIEELKGEGLWIAGADARGDQTHFTADLKGPLGLVIGSEGSGLRRLVREKCDFLLKIPMKGTLGSLNASVAAAVILYEAVRQRLKDMA